VLLFIFIPLNTQHNYHPYKHIHLISNKTLYWFIFTKQVQTTISKHTLHRKDVVYMPQHMDKELIALIELSEEIARKMKANYLGSEHILLALLKTKNSYIRVFVSPYQMTYNNVYEALEQCCVYSSMNSLTFTKSVEAILECTLQSTYTEHKQKAKIRDLELALLQYPECVAYELLLEYKVDINELKSLIERDKWMSELNKIKELQNLNIKMENEKPIVLGRDKEINMIITILSRKEKANPLLIGEPGIGKSAIIEEVARRIAHKEVPVCMQDTIIYELNINTLVAGTKYRGEFEEKMDRICSTVKKYRNAVLFIDEIHQIVGAGKAEGSIDVATVFKPYLARSEIRVIGATTLTEYTKYIENDRALERRFQTITILEPRKEEVFDMLSNKIRSLCTYHQVKITPEIIHYAIEESDRYLINRYYPDKTIDVIDLAATRTKLNNKVYIDKKDIQCVIEELTNITHDDTKTLNIQPLIRKYPTLTPSIHTFQKSYLDTHYHTEDTSPTGVYYLCSPNRNEVNEFTRDLASAISTKTSYVELPLHLYNEASSLYYLTSSKDGPFYTPWKDLKKTPQTLFLLLNFDLAHMDVQHFFMRIFELGKWKDTEGKEHDFRNCIFLITKEQKQVSKLGLERTTHTPIPYADEYIQLSEFTRTEFDSYAELLMESWQVEIAEDLLEDCYDRSSDRKSQIRNLKRVLSELKTNQNA